MVLKQLYLKPLTSETIEAVFELDRACLNGLWSLEGYQRELNSPNSEILTLSVRNNDQFQVMGMGCFWAILEEAHLTLLAVHPDFQGQGLGQLLLYFLLKLAMERQLERATLEVKVSNNVARSLYHKFGFQEAGIRRKYYQETQEDAVILWLNGLHHPQFRETLEQWEQEIQERLLKHQWELRELPIAPPA